MSSVLDSVFSCTSGFLIHKVGFKWKQLKSCELKPLSSRVHVQVLDMIIKKTFKISGIWDVRDDLMVR